MWTKFARTANTHDLYCRTGIERSAEQFFNIPGVEQTDRCILEHLGRHLRDSLRDPRRDSAESAFNHAQEHCALTLGTAFLTAFFQSALIFAPQDPASA